MGREKSKMHRQSRKQAVMARQKSSDAAVVESAVAAAGAGSGVGAPAGALLDSGSDSDAGATESEYSLEEMLDQLGAKRGSAREVALQWMVHYTQHTVADEALESNLNSIMNAASTSLRKSKPRECRLAALLLAVCAVHVGPDQETKASSTIASLRLMLDKKSAGEDAHAAAVASIAMVCMICATEESTSAGCLELFENLLTAPRTPASVRVQALLAWALLSSVQSTAQMRENVIRVLPYFTAHLYHPSSDVRTAAGSCVAMLYEAKHGRSRAVSVDAVAAAVEDDDDYDYEDDSDAEGSDTDHDEEEKESRKADWHWREPLGDDWAIDNDDQGAARKTYIMSKLHESLLERLAELTTDSAKHRSRKERREMRMAFRDILHTVESGKEPVTEYRIRTSVAELWGWGSRVRLGALRDLLGAGLQVQLEFNPTVRAVLGLGGVVSRGITKMSKIEKRAFLSPNSSSSKNRTASRASGRRDKHATNQAFLAGE